MKKEVMKKCPVTKKSIYSSEAKALKFVDRYEDIKRAYYCEHCDGYHTTSKTIGQVVSYGVVEKEELEQPKEITIDMLAERLKELGDKL